MMETLLAIAAGFLLDIIFGDPLWLPHPVRGIGRLISGGEKLARKIGCKTENSAYFHGMILALAVAGIAFILPFAALYLARSFSPVLGFILETVMCYQILALKDLKTESMKVYTALQKNDLQGARTAVSGIVGRDTQSLNPEQIGKATVETVAENLSDGVIAPLFYLFIGGAPLGFLYKAINTLDSMVGYKNEKYLYFGRFAAKLDDLANYIPARLSAYLMLLAVWLCRFDFKGAWKTYRRDRRKHASPNSAHTEAVCAGALNIQLGGGSYYFGKFVEKPLIGDDLRSIENADIKRANRLLYAASFLALILGSGLGIAIELLLTQGR